jgi:hypothetical protein
MNWSTENEERLNEILSKHLGDSDKASDLLYRVMA